MSKKLNPSRKSIESGKETKLQVGRPRSYMPDELEQSIEDYFQYCLDYKEQQATAKGDVVNVSKPRIPTMGGLMNFLDMDRVTWHEYSQVKEYTNIIKKTDNKIREAKEEALVNVSTPVPSMPMVTFVFTLNVTWLLGVTCSSVQPTKAIAINAISFFISLCLVLF